jgi:CRP-like cAMP-binding protein
VRVSPPVNRLLASLPPAAYRRLAGSLKEIQLSNGDVLCQPGASMRHVYFPGECVISLLVVLERDVSLEVGLVGSEGMVGAGAALGSPGTPVRVLVQRAGSAMKCSGSRFAREVKASPALALAVDRHLYCAMATAMQIAACNRTHLLGPRLARWLLMMRDRGASEDLRLTQDLLSKMLGVRRSGVTLAASALQRRGLISYSRGRVRILAPDALRRMACSCYEVIRKLTGSGG